MRPAFLPPFLLFLGLATACVPKPLLPERGDPDIGRGDTAYARGDLAAAETHYGRAIARGGAEVSEAYYLRGRVRFERKDDAGAEQDALGALATSPKHWEALTLLGMALDRQGRRKEAITRFREAAGIAPGALSPRNNLAFLELQDGNVREAYDLLVEIVRDHPDSIRAWSNLALAAERLGLADEAARAREAAARAADAASAEPDEGDGT